MPTPRRTFIQTLLAATAAAQSPPENAQPTGADIGTLYPQIDRISAAADYPLSFLSGNFAGVDAYRQAARAKVFELFQYDPDPVKPEAEVVDRWEHDDYIQERILFNTAPWFRIPAYVLIPKGFSGPRPAIVDLHSHGGMFVFGKEKVMPMPGGDHPSIAEYRTRNYGGRSTSLELCRRGYVVISIDAFYFGERRTIYDDVAAQYGTGRSKYSTTDVQTLNRRASRGESTLVKSPFWAGATWQGIVHRDDIATVDYLVTRPEVDPERIGCLGISLGGDRTDYLAGLDPRIRCAVSIGWMSTLREMVRAHVDTHSFVHFLPGLAHHLDLPDLLGCMAPKPLMAQYCTRDALYPLDGMKASAEKLRAIYSKAGASEALKTPFYDETHTFSLEMHSEAFDFLARHR